MPISAYVQVRESPHQMLVAKGHTTDADDVLAEADSYDVVAIKPEYGDPSPPNADHQPRGLHAVGLRLGACRVVAGRGPWSPGPTDWSRR